MKTSKQYPKGHFFNIGLAVGIPFSVIAGIIFGNMAYGPITGITAGVILGFFLERIYNPNPVEQDPEIASRQRRVAWRLVIAGLVVFLIVTTVYLFQIT